MKAKIKKDNNGFSLIELIIVVAIMAVLTAVLAPQYLKYVDKARRQKDVNMAYEMVNVIKVLQADIDTYTYDPFIDEKGNFSAVMFGKKYAIMAEGSEEKLMEKIRNPNGVTPSGGKKVIYADLLDMLGGIPESSLGEEYTWLIAIDVSTGNTELVALYNVDIPDSSYILYPEHENFMKGIGVTYEALMARVSAIGNE